MSSNALPSLKKITPGKMVVEKGRLGEVGGILF